MKCTTCGVAKPEGLVTITENNHERICEMCEKSWLSSVNRRLFEQHVAEGRDGNALSEYRSWAALRSRAA